MAGFEDPSQRHDESEEATADLVDFRFTAAAFKMNSPRRKRPQGVFY